MYLLFWKNETFKAKRLKEIKEALSLHTQLSLNKDLETDDYCVFAEKHDGRTIRFDKDIHDISELPFYTID